MGAARRGYILIAVLWALALVGAVAAAYAYATRTNVAQVRAEAERTQAYYAARGACIQSVKDLAAGVRHAQVSFGAERVANDPNISIDKDSGGVQIGNLPAFPAEMAGAGGLLGAIANKLNQVQGSAPPPPPAENDGGSGRGNGGRDGTRAREEQSDAPLLVLGAGTMNFNGARVEVWLESETGKLNINLTPRAMLERLLVSMGQDGAVARGLLDDIERYRMERLSEKDPARNTVARRAPEQPLDGRDFRNIEELINVPGIDATLQARLMGVLTVYGAGGIDPNYATEPVLRAVGIVDERPLEFVLAMQAAQERITPEGLRQSMGTSAYSRVSSWLTFGASPVFTARTHAQVGESSARYLIRVAPGSGTGSGASVTTLLESREDWL